MEGIPWLIGGDFNIFAAEEERKGKRPCSRNKKKEMLEFVETISDCQLLDPGYDGAQYTWSRGDLFERLDRALMGEGWHSTFPNTRVTNLPRVGSDHGPILIRCCREHTATGHAFRFQNMWVRHATFGTEVRKVWEENSEFGGMRNLHLKLTRVKKRLKIWNKETFGNIFENIKMAEERVAAAQSDYEENPSATNRCANNLATTHLLLTLKMEEDFWRQRASIKWVAEGERNTKFFQGWARQKRVRSRIHQIKEGEETIADEVGIKDSATRFFKELLTEGQEELEEPNLDIIQPLPEEIDMDILCNTPSYSEVKKAVFSIAADSAPGPDGFTALFYQFCWDIVGEDVTAAVREFFGGAYMPRSFTATMVVLLPKRDRPITWADYRPISLCNVSNKIIAKIIASRLAPIMPHIISPNQSGFVQGRLLSDNVLLAQELLQDLEKGSQSPNIAIKLDMAKAYDRVEWLFLLKILERMGFSHKWRGLIERSISSNWFSILINGSPGGFFKSTRGLRQGDPLSPALFVIAAEYLSRSLDKTIIGNKALEYSTGRHAPGISHLAYADDVIVFTKASRPALREVIGCLDHYAAVSGQKINMGKSQYYMDAKYRGWGRRVARSSGFQQGALPFEYLGVPIFRGIKKTSLFLFLRDKISKRIHSWSHKFLSFGGRLTLIKSTLGAIPLHICQVMEPTGGAMKQMESMIARFFWGSNNDEKRTHWIAWDQICHPINEGGLGVRRLHDMVAAFGMKLWWRFREKQSLWADFMLKKYCHKHSPAEATMSKRSSPTWKRMIRARARTQQHMRWSIGEGALNVWDDVWLADVPLRQLCTPGANLPTHDVREFWVNNSWDETRIRASFPLLGVPNETIRQILDTPIDGTGKDEARWSLTPHGDFSSTSAWECVRHQQEKVDIFNLIWNPAISPSMSIFVWRLLVNRVPVDAKLQWRNIHLASKCRCCKEPRGETREHLFIHGLTATKIWRYFANWFPDAPPWPRDCTDMVQRIRWWNENLQGVGRDHISSIIPCLILWFIWIERNNVVHRGTIFNSGHVIERIQGQLQWAISAKVLDPCQWKGAAPSVRFTFPRRRRDRTVQPRIIRWNLLLPGWIKLNTDGSFLGPNQVAGGGGVIRDERGRILGGFAEPFRADSAREAELLALNQGIEIAKGLGYAVWIETDSLEMVNMIKKDSRGAAQNRHLLTDIRNKLRGLNFNITHICREGNKVADYLATQGRNREDRITINHDLAPPMVKALARIDRMGIPNMRE